MSTTEMKEEDTPKIIIDKTDEVARLLHNLDIEDCISVLLSVFSAVIRTAPPHIQSQILYAITGVVSDISDDCKRQQDRKDMH